VTSEIERIGVGIQMLGYATAIWSRNEYIPAFPVAFHVFLFNALESASVKRTT